jgi:diguanylate cyclase (GGDEF)-like protein
MTSIRQGDYFQVRRHQGGSSMGSITNESVWCKALTGAFRAHRIEQRWLLSFSRWSNQMSKSEIAFPKTGAEERAEEIRRDLRRLGRHDWSLWGATAAVILALTVAIGTFSASVGSERSDPFYQFNISQSVRGLVGLVLVFSLYTLYQQVQLRRTRGRLASQIAIAAREHQRAEDFLKLAMLDSLTGLHNRRFCEERMAAEIARADRHGNSLTVLALDLDNLKQINDRYGHTEGDLALKVFADCLSKAIRGSDLAVRMGGDEFVVLLPDCHFGQVQRVLNRLAPLEIEAGGAKVSFTFSAGWTDYEAHEKPEHLLERADHALYAQKQARTHPSHPVAHG